MSPEYLGRINKGSALESRNTECEILLVRELAKSNVLAFNTLYKKYSGRLYKFANGYLKSKTESEELVQEVFTIIWDRRLQLKEELSFKSFLFTISFNLIQRHFRTKAHIAEYLKTRVEKDIDLQTPQKINYDSLHQYLTGLVDQLPLKRKEIFIKSRFEGLSIKEIAAEMGISHKTVENQLTDALRFIRKRFILEQVL